jgi:hypothetical protein
MAQNAGVFKTSFVRVGLPVVSFLSDNDGARACSLERARLLFKLAKDSSPNSKERKERKATKLFDSALGIVGVIQADVRETSRALAEIFSNMGDFERSARAYRLEVEASRIFCNPLKVDLSAAYTGNSNEPTLKQLDEKITDLKNLASAGKNGAEISRKTGDTSGVAYFLRIETDASAMRAIVEGQKARLASPLK